MNINNAKNNPIVLDANNRLKLIVIRHAYRKIKLHKKFVFLASFFALQEWWCQATDCNEQSLKYFSSDWKAQKTVSFVSVDSYGDKNWIGCHDNAKGMFPIQIRSSAKGDKGEAVYEKDYI